MHFSNIQILPLVLGIILLVSAVISFRNNRVRSGILFLVAGTFGLGCFMALLDPFLNTWDEVFHALVAKNLIANPFHPVLLKTPVLEYDFRIWTDNHIWLHKQPLFLWQMALSMKIFGVNEFAVRLPSVIMHAIIPVFIYRIGAIALNNKTGFYAALFFSLAYYPLELISGKYSTDHNDIAFLFYITASCFAWFEYIKSKKNYWLILIGIFAGCAVLVKWLMGLLVYVCWSFTFITEKGKLTEIKRYFPFIKSFLISILVFLPWQLYTLIRFPAESRYELSAFADHLHETVEGHGGDHWFHFEAIRLLYGSGFLIPVLIILSLLFLFKRIASLNNKVFISGAIAFVYLLYSFAATKMYSFTIIVAPFIFLGFSSLYCTVIDYLEGGFKRKSLQVSFFALLTISICYGLFNFKQIEINHTLFNPGENNNRANKLAEKSMIDNLGTFIPDKTYIIFNSRFAQAGDISTMFYSDYIAYRFIPSEEQCEKVMKRGYRIAILDFGNLPDYIHNQHDIIKIPVYQ